MTAWLTDWIYVFSGALLDSYTIASNRDLFPSNKFEIQEVIQQDTLEYGARVLDLNLGTCLRNYRYTQEGYMFELLEYQNDGSLKVWMDLTI